MFVIDQCGEGDPVPSVPPLPLASSTAIGGGSLLAQPTTTASASSVPISSFTTRQLLYLAPEPTDPLKKPSGYVGGIFVG